jgi:hypothetical protein
MKIASTALLTLALAVAAAPSFAADATSKALTPQQQRMKDCNAQATEKKGEERRAFMSTCLKGGSTTAAAAPEAAQPAKKKSKSAH